MIALTGIVVRNSIILIDFVEHIRRSDRSDPSGSLEAAIVEAGATRLRPIVLIAAAAMFTLSSSRSTRSSPAWHGGSFFGIFASSDFTLAVVPVVYFLINRTRAIV